MADDPTSQLTKLQQQAQALVDDRQMATVDDAQRSAVHRFVHFWVLVVQHFLRNRCVVRATALAYTTLLALVPLLAVSLGVSTSLLKSDQEQTKEMISRLVDEVAPQLGLLPGTADERLAAQRKVVDQIQDFIANVHSGALGLTGTVALIFVAIGLLSTVETTFNDIWGVAQGRSWVSRIIHYWAAITLGPLLVILAMGLSIGSQFQAVQDMVQEMPVIGSLIFNMLPFLILSGSFGLLYQLMPHTHVDWRAAAVGGLVSGLLWDFNSNFNVLFASRVVSASKIYGPLGVFPVFLIGLYFSWLILLFGAQVAYAFQNRRAYLQEKQADIVNQRGREFVALRLMALIGQRFHHGHPPPTLSALAEELAVSSRLAGRLVQQLVQAQLVVEVNTPTTAYCPARPLAQISCEDILLALRVGQGFEPPTREGPGREAVRQALGRVQEAEAQVAQPLTLQSLVDRFDGPPPA